MDVATVVSRAAERFSGQVALEGPDGTRTFAQLGDRIARLARGLRSLGLQDEDRVLDLQTNSCTYVESDLGISAAGLCRVALNYRLRPADWARIAADSGARALIVHERFLDQGALGLLDAVEHVVVVGGDGPGTPFEALIESSSGGSLPAVQRDRLASLNYSSGTTGAPKGAERTHRNRVASLANMVTDVLGRPQPDDVWLHAGPITHASGLFVLPHLAFGARQILLPSWDSDAFVDTVRERGVTGSVLVPTMVSRLLAAEPDHEDFASLRRLCYAGAPMPSEHIVAARSRITPHLVQFYGLVEAMPPVTVLDAEGHRRAVEEQPLLLRSCGRPAFGVGLAVLDEDGREVPNGEVGELSTSGDHVMRGYFSARGRSDDDKDSKSVVDGWLRTGDVGWIDDSGYVYLVDRRGDMIITGGYNVYPREVEDAIATMPGVQEVAVVGVPDDEWGQRIVAFYASGALLDEGALKRHCSASLPGFKKPREFHRVEAMPLNSTGKIDKRALATLISGAL
jgi:acyl-CoA synthetase (AMP-forming)/AMP-acid ligase II